MTGLVERYRNLRAQLRLHKTYAEGFDLGYEACAFGDARDWVFVNAGLPGLHGYDAASATLHRGPEAAEDDWWRGYADGLMSRPYAEAADGDTRYACGYRSGMRLTLSEAHLYR